MLNQCQGQAITDVIKNNSNKCACNINSIYSRPRQR